jgi:hypothetical protein
LPLPVDADIVYSWVQAGVDVVGLVAREDDVSSVAALVEGLEDCRDIVGGVISTRKDGASGASIVISDGDVLCYRLGYDRQG